MTGNSLLIVAVASLAAALANAQTISVDMDAATGIQQTVLVEDTGETVEIPLRITDAEQMFSYQFKVAFDTAAFAFLGAQQDFGITGEKNILAGNGGSIIGIFQLQANPPATDTVEFSCSITGTDNSKSVSGDGLVGVLYLKSRLLDGDSSMISVSQGMVAAYGGDLTPMESYAGGVYKIVLPVVVNRTAHPGSPVIRNRSVTLSFGSYLVPFDVPGGSDARIAVKLFSLEGKLLTSRNMMPASNDRYIPVTMHHYASGSYLCTICSGVARVSRTIRIP